MKAHTMRTILEFASCFLAFQANAQGKLPYALRAFRECEYFLAFLFLGAETSPQDFRSSVKQTCGKHLEDDPSVGLSVDRAIEIFMTLAIGDLVLKLDHGLRQESLDARLHAGLPAREASENASRLFRQEGLVQSLHASVHEESTRQTEA